MPMRLQKEMGGVNKMMALFFFYPDIPGIDKNSLLVARSIGKLSLCVNGKRGHKI